MAVNVKVPGLSTTNISSFSVQEDATPIEPSSSAGGVGQISVGLDDFADAQQLIGQVILADGTRGKTSGNIRTLSSSDGKLTVTADSVLGKFNTDRTVQPYVGTLGGAIQFYSDLVDIQNDIVTDSTITSRPVTYAGFKGNVWVAIKQILAKEQVEMALVFDRVYVRPLRKLTINQNRKTSDGWAIDNNNAARTVEVYYYNNDYGTQREVYPRKGEAAPIYSVGAGETLVFTEQLNASMISVNQPVVQDFVNNTTFSGTNGVYAVSGNDGLPITAAQWTAQGGSVKVRMTDDPSIIEITVTGARSTLPAPFRIAMTSGSSNYYNSLHITGTAVTWDKQMVTLRTGVPDADTSTLVGVTVDNPFISTYEQALNLGTKTAAAYAGLNYTVSGSAHDINRAGEGRELIQATIGDFNVAYVPGTTIAAFNAVWAGDTIADFNDFWGDQVDLLWENQLFGNAPGARVLDDDANFRVTSATTTETIVQYSAALDTLVGDFNDKWPEGGTTTVTTNIFTDPEAVGLTAFETNVSMTLSTTTGWAGHASAARTTRVSSAAARMSAVVGTALTTATQWTSLLNLRASIPMTGVQFFYRPTASSSSNQVSLGTMTIPAGESVVRLTGALATAPSSTASITAVWTSANIGETLDMTGITIVQGTYTDGDFSGSMTDTHINGVTTLYDWVGATNASASTKTVTTNDFLISDFNTQFAGKTMKDFNTIPLRRN